MVNRQKTLPRLRDHRRQRLSHQPFCAPATPPCHAPTPSHHCRVGCTSTNTRTRATPPPGGGGVSWRHTPTSSPLPPGPRSRCGRPSPQSFFLPGTFFRPHPTPLSVHTASHRRISRLSYPPTPHRDYSYAYTYPQQQWSRKSCGSQSCTRTWIYRGKLLIYLY